MREITPKLADGVEIGRLTHSGGPGQRARRARGDRLDEATDGEVREAIETVEERRESPSCPRCDARLRVEDGAPGVEIHRCSECRFEGAVDPITMIGRLIARIARRARA